MGWAQNFEITFLETEQLFCCSADEYLCTRHINRLFCIHSDEYIYLLCHCHRSVSLENSLTQYHRSQCYFIVFPTQHKITWAEMSPRYLFLLFSKQTTKKILIIKYLFHWQILPYFLRKFQNKVSIFTSMQRYNFFPVFSSGQGDFFAHHWPPAARVIKVKLSMKKH